MSFGRTLALRGLILAVGLGISVSAVTAQISAIAPENLRCSGQPAPPAPGPGWQVLPVWEWREVHPVGSPIGSSEGPVAGALGRQGNRYRTRPDPFIGLQLPPRGGAVAP